jgi:hypothetical protein
MRVFLAGLGGFPANRAACVGILLGGLLAGFATGEEAALPQIVEPVFRFADTVSPAEIRHVFVLANPGTTELRVTRVRSTCGCTTAGVEPETIPPGGEGRLELVFKTGNRVGMQRKQVFVNVEHPQVSLLRCSIEGMLLSPAPAEPPAAEPVARPRPPAAKAVAVLPVAPLAPAEPAVGAVVADPDTIYLRNVPPGQVAEGALRLASLDGKPFAVASVQCPLAGLTVAAEPANAERSVWRLAYRFQTEASGQRLRGFVTVTTDHPGPPLRIRLSGNVAAPLAQPTP